MQAETEPQGEEDCAAAEPTGIRLWEWMVVLLCVIAGAALRLWQVRHAPGLFYDEAIYGLDGVDVLRKPGWPIFFTTEGHMREPMFMYLLAIGIRIGGTTAETIRTVSAVIGTLTIPVVWLLAREWRGRLFAALAVVIFATMRWHVHFSGLSFRVILAPLFLALTFLFFQWAVRRRSGIDAALCGLALGVGLYTYLAFRLVPLMVGIGMAAALAAHWQERKALGGVFTIIIGVSLLVFAPLGLHYWQNPTHFTGRGEEVNFLGREDSGRLLLRQTRDVLLMPLVRGDHVGKHNLPGPPTFLQLGDMPGEQVAEMWALERQAARMEQREPMDPHGTGTPAFGFVGGILFYIGLVVVALSIRSDWRGAAWLAWLGIGIMASVLSFGAPNMLRLLYLTPVAALMIARGIEAAATLAHKGASRIVAGRFPAIVAGLVALVLLAAILRIDTRRLAAWPRHPMVPIEFNVEWRTIGDYLRRQHDRMPVRLPSAMFGTEGNTPPTLRFLADGYVFSDEPMGSEWWELRTVEPFPLMEKPQGWFDTQSRSLRVEHPAGLKFGVLHEVRR